MLRRHSWRWPEQRVRDAPSSHVRRQYSCKNVPFSHKGLIDRFLGSYVETYATVAAPTSRPSAVGLFLQ